MTWVSSMSLGCVHEQKFLDCDSTMPTIDINGSVRRMDFLFLI